MTTSTQWQLAHAAAERYERIAVPTILGPYAKILVDSAQLKLGDFVLDVGCGTGAAARYAAAQVGPSGRVIGLDVNAGMIAVAKELPQFRVSASNGEKRARMAYRSLIKRLMWSCAHKCCSF